MRRTKNCGSSEANAKREDEMKGRDGNCEFKKERDCGGGRGWEAENIPLMNNLEIETY